MVTCWMDDHLHTSVSVPDGQTPSEFSLNYKCLHEVLSNPEIQDNLPYC